MAARGRARDDGRRATAIPDRPSDAAGRRQRLAALCATLPEAEAERAGARHIAFKVRKKIFAYYVDDHHGDGRIALWCKAPPGEQGSLVAESPDRYFVPPYVGPRGWIGLRLDTRALDWKAVRDLAFAAYVLTAPDALRRRIGRATPGTRREPQGAPRGRRGSGREDHGERHAVRDPS